MSSHLINLNEESIKIKISKGRVWCKRENYIRSK